MSRGATNYAIKWVATIKTVDGVTVHLEASRSELQMTKQTLRAEFGPDFDEAWSIAAKSRTWECDGIDGCTVDA